jgi:hypothetical protein
MKLRSVGRLASSSFFFVLLASQPSWSSEEAEKPRVRDGESHGTQGDNDKLVKSVAARSVAAGQLDAKSLVTPGGSFVHSIPVPLPPGAGSHQPQLSLDYHSSMPNGLLGVGWVLTGLPAVTRVNTGARSRVCGAGLLLV